MGLAVHQQLWDSVAGGWEEHADFADEREAELTAHLLDLVALEPGDRVLELACGPGGVGLAAARRIAGHGHVVLSDAAPRMVAVAESRAAALGIHNVSFKQLDLEQIDEPDDSYDVVLCREGLMLVPDPDGAATEIRRVLRPGGRLALAVWGPRERNPWLGIVLDSVSEQLGVQVPPPGVPGPFSLEDAVRLESILAGAGLHDVRVTEHEVPYRAASSEEWWVRTVALAGPLATMLGSLPASAADAVRDRARGEIAAYETGGRLEIPGVSLVASARG
ncbi:MAG TPA: class I SAM-dependent methyltransferase [Thermoleophilaceae bacterium]